MSGNTLNRDKTSMAAELLNIISMEEYVTYVEKFSSTAYLNKLELSSLKKMVSGKLWLDSRKFVSRQNNVIVNGLFALFGSTLGKSASDVRAEACDFLLDADQCELRTQLRRSVNNSGITYSKWIGRLASDSYPCDEFGLFLLSLAFKRHVLVVLADKTWSTFKPGRMSTFEKICKADHVLVWMGEDRYCEVKPLQVKISAGVSNIAEWQQLAESVDILHSKSKSRARRIEKANASVKTPPKRINLPSPVRQPPQRDRKRSIDYKQLHKDGVYEEKKRRIDKYPPQSSGPSEQRLYAQQQIVQTKRTPERRKVATTEYAPRRLVSITKPTLIKQEHLTSYSTGIVKPEPGIHLRRRVIPSDKDRTWKFVHVSGRPCNQGGDKDCNSQSENEDNPDTLDTLPDLPRVNASTYVFTRSKSGNTIPAITRSNTEDLTSPPAIQRKDFQPCTSKKSTATNLGDLLCTLNFDVQVAERDPQNEPQARSVTTLSTKSLPERQTIPVIPAMPSRSVVINTETEDEIVMLSPTTKYIRSEPNTATETRQVVTETSTILTPKATVSTQPLLTVATSSSELSTPNSMAHAPMVRTPAHTTATPSQMITIVTSSSEPTTPKTPLKEAGSSNDQTMLNDKASSLPSEDDQTRDSTNLNSTPRSVVTDPDASELETASALLQLGTLSDSGSKHQDQLDEAYDNSVLLPVDAAPLVDFARNMSKNDTVLVENKNPDNANETVESTDSDKTVDYSPKDTPEKELPSPKGNLRYKQYGIKRPSPKAGPNRNRRCPYCEVVCHSKRDWNIHHKSEHTKVQCPDCQRLFPTPDALNRHRYIHNEDHTFKCDICGKICAFQSDLDQHKSKHNEEKLWYCSHDGCSRDFKRKSDLTAHEIVHTGEDFICEFPNCDFTRKDPRLVKRHQRVHTKEAKVECPVCGKKFVFYMQMKRHRDATH